MNNYHIHIDEKESKKDTNYDFDANFNDYKSNKKNGNWLNLYYAEWCGHCHDFMPIWDKFVKRCRDNNTNINTVKIESNHLSSLGKNVGGYPTITFLNSNSKNEIDFDGERTVEGLEEFVNSNNSQKGGKRKRRTKRKKSNNTKKTRKNKKNKRKNLKRRYSKRKHSGGGILDAIETKLQTLENMIGTQSFE